MRTVTYSQGVRSSGVSLDLEWCGASSLTQVPPADGVRGVDGQAHSPHPAIGLAVGRVYADGPLAVLHCPCVVPQFAVGCGSGGGQAERSGSQLLLAAPSPVEGPGKLSAHAWYLLMLTHSWLPTQPGVSVRMAAEPPPPHPWVRPLFPFSPTAHPGPCQQLSPPPCSRLHLLQK